MTEAIPVVLSNVGSPAFHAVLPAFRFLFIYPFLTS